MHRNASRFGRGFLLVVGMLAMCAALLAGCTVSPQVNGTLTIASLKGPTSISLAPLMAEADNQVLLEGQPISEDSRQATGHYRFDVSGTTDSVVASMAQGEADIALVPANLAAMLFQRTNGDVTVIDVNALGSLCALSKSSDVFAVGDLGGRTVYLTGKGTVPQYTLDALLASSGLSEAALDIRFKSEPAEVLAAIIQDDRAVGILPQPYASVALTKDSQLETVFDLTEQWDATMGSGQGSLVTGVTVVRDEVLRNRPDAVKAFLSDHVTAAQEVNAHPEKYAQIIADLGIIPAAALGPQVIPHCNVVCLTGSAMKDALQGYLTVLFSIDSASVGGALPDDSFYYVQ